MNVRTPESVSGVQSRAVAKLTKKNEAGFGFEYNADMWRLHLPTLLLLAAMVNIAGAQPPAPFQPSISLLDGQSLPLKEISIAGGKVTAEGLPDNLRLDDLRQINVGPIVPPPKEKPGIVLQLVGVGRLRAEALTIENDICRVTAPGVETLGIPLEKVRAIRFDHAANVESLDKAIAAPSAESDRIFIKVDDAVESVSGVTLALDDSELKVQVEGAERAIPRTRLVAIAVTQPSGEDALPYVTVTLRDGSTLPGEIESLSGGKLSLAFSPNSKLTIPWSAIASVTVRSRRVAFLSDLKPSVVEQHSIAFLDVPWKRDRSVMGRTLTIGNRTFEKGIGVHATSKLTFDAGGSYDELAAEIGIDAETAGKGDCIFAVLADGERLFSQRVKGTDPPRAVRVDIRGKKEVTLVVEAGEGLDLADHGDWGDVRFIKGERGASAP